MRKSLAAATMSVAAAAMLVLSGCGNDSASPAGPATTTDTATTPATTTGAPDTTTTSAAPGKPGPDSCAETKLWNTDPESDDTMSPSVVYNSRIGQHDCYDRLVFDINGPEPVGYDVRYVPEVTEDGSGKPVTVAGEAALQVVVRSWAQGTLGDMSGHQPGVIFAPSGKRLHGPEGLEDWGCLREVRSAGSFEGQTTFAVGVRDELPFRVDTWTDSEQVTHVIVDLACG